MSCLLVAGLGNPGASYQYNRHNIGHRVLDFLSEKLAFDFSLDMKFNAQIGKIMIEEKRIYFLKPQTFMNLSGESIAPFARYFDAKAIMVIHDELDIPFGNIRFKNAGSSGGHNGLKSLDSHYGNEYFRLRFGIGRPSDSQRVVDYVLSDFTDDEENKILPLIEHCKEAVMSFCLNPDIALLQSRFSLKLKNITTKDTDAL